MIVLAQTPPPDPVPGDAEIRSPAFWLALVLLATLSCLLIYGIFETRLRMALATGAAAVDLLRRNTRRLWILIAGTAVILFGILIAPLPGPGPVILVPIGLGILATEFAWARRLQLELKRRTSPLGNATKHVVDHTPRWVVIPALLIYWCIPAAVASFTNLPQKAVWSVASMMFAPFLLWAWMVYKAAWVGSKRESHAPEAEPAKSGGSEQPS
ncbi:MAG: PGPGW domain-containing protein [Phycisphaerales bacterium]